MARIKAHSTILRVSLAQRVFGAKNGASSFLETRRLIEKRRPEAGRLGDYKIGCILRVENGILLRYDVHKLFDAGYLSASHLCYVALMSGIQD
jgi:hypothetical protein